MEEGNDRLVDLRFKSQEAVGKLAGGRALLPGQLVPIPDVSGGGEQFDLN